MILPNVFFSIIIPTFNRAQLLIETIQSILTQDDIEIEIIVVDDGSTDDTEQRVGQMEDDRIRYVKSDNLERGAARNLGLQLSTGLYVNYFDSDDLFYPCLATLRDFIVNEGSPNVVYGSIDRIKEDGRIQVSRGLPFSTFKKNILFNNFLACGSVFIKREVATYFLFSDDRRLSGSEDWELWIRLYVNYDFIGAPVTIFKQRDHANRSLVKRNVDQVTTRENVFAELINKNRDILKKRFSDDQLDLLVADRMTLIALTQFEGGNRGTTLKYWIRSLRISLRVMKRKRFWAVAKKLMVS